MILVPVRWLVLGGIALCGYFIITSNSTNYRAGAFVVSVFLWQAHGIITVYDGYLLMKVSAAKTRIKQQLEVVQKVRDEFNDVYYWDAPVSEKKRLIDTDPTVEHVLESVEQKIRGG